MNQQVWSKVKQVLLASLLGASLSLIPFYYQTNAMTQKANEVNVEQGKEIHQALSQLHQLEVKGAVDDTEIKQIKASLERIEKKIDRLIENDK